MATAAASATKITAVKALLFYDKNGQFSRDILSDPEDLWNTIIGEGSSGGASHSTLVIVEIAGPPEGYVRNSRVDLIAVYKGFRRGRDLRVQQTGSTGMFSDEGRSYVGFWLYDTGCSEVQISVTLNGDQRQKRQAIIPFRCGE